MFNQLKSIRSKLTIWYSFIVLSTLVAFGLIAYTSTRDQLSNNLDRSLANEVRWVNNFIKPIASRVKPSKRFSSKKKVSPLVVLSPQKESSEFATADDEIWAQIHEHALLNPKKTMIEVTDLKGGIVFRSYSVTEESLMVGEAALNSVKLTTIRSSKGEELRVASTSNENVRIYAAYPLSELNDVLENLFSIFLILIPGAMIVSIGGGWLLAYTSLRPVDLVTRQARGITAHNLGQQLPPRGVNDEIGRLILTFNDMIVRLRHSFEHTKQFSLDASHELRTPLTIMRGEVEIALRNPQTPEAARVILSSNLEEIVRLSAIIDGLLMLSRADLGQDVMLFEEVDLQKLVEELFEDSEILANKKRIVMELAIKERLTIIGDAGRLRQLFLNLIDNAVKYTPEGGRVRLSLVRDDACAKVSVSDSGVGIPHEEQDKIFDRFYRVDKARSRELGGSGLGLSIAKWIVDKHRGRIDVVSSPGNGSTFTVSLPCPSQREKGSHPTK